MEKKKSPASILFVPACSYTFSCGSLQMKKKITDVFGGHQVHLEKGISTTALLNSTRLSSSIWTNVVCQISSLAVQLRVKIALII